MVTHIKLKITANKQSKSYILLFLSERSMSSQPVRVLTTQVFIFPELFTIQKIIFNNAKLLKLSYAWSKPLKAGCRTSIVCLLSF